jgi:hypothetical protein
MLTIPKVEDPKTKEGTRADLLKDGEVIAEGQYAITMAVAAIVLSQLMPDHSWIVRHYTVGENKPTAKEKRAMQIEREIAQIEKEEQGEVEPVYNTHEEHLDALFEELKRKKEGRNAVQE